MGDQEQPARLQSEVFAPPLCPDHGLPVQDVDRRVEGLQHRQRGHVDATDRQTDGMAPQMVDQRFDLGKFGHATSLPIAVLRCLTEDCRRASARVPAPSPPWLPLP